MADTTHELVAFTAFAQARLKAGAQDSLDDLFDEWRVANPTGDDLPAIRASLRDMEAGETGRLFEEFAAEFRSKHDIVGDGQ